MFNISFSFKWHSFIYNYYYLSDLWQINSLLLTLKAHSLKEGVKEKGAGINLGNVQVKSVPKCSLWWSLCVCTNPYWNRHRRSENVSTVLFCWGTLLDFLGGFLFWHELEIACCMRFLQTHSSTNINCPNALKVLFIYVCVLYPTNDRFILNVKVL